MENNKWGGFFDRFNSFTQDHPYKSTDGTMGSANFGNLLGGLGYALLGGGGGQQNGAVQTDSEGRPMYNMAMKQRAMDPQVFQQRQQAMQDPNNYANGGILKLLLGNLGNR